ncbi:MAG: glycosyltransferase [Acinetobacter sp.]
MGNIDNTNSILPQNVFLLSVIIPCYNCEQYIHDCLQSVCKQICNAVEIIIINDGSTDNSLNIINNFSNNYKDKTIKVISQKNQGLSAARNAGITLASGNYLAFLDGDDLWAPSFWETIKNAIQNLDVDLIEFDAARFYDGNTEKRTTVSIVSMDGLSKTSSIRDLKETFKKNEWFAWSRVYKKELFNTLRFPAGRNYEDIATIPFIYLASSKIRSIKKELLLYRVREGSITFTPSMKNIDDAIHALAVFKKILQQQSNCNIDIIAPAVYLTYGLVRRISTQKHGYYFLNKEQCNNLRIAITPFMGTFKFSIKIKVKYIHLYCQLNKIKNLLKYKIIIPYKKESKKMTSQLTRKS